MQLRFEMKNISKNYAFAITALLMISLIAITGCNNNDLSKRTKEKLLIDGIINKQDDNIVDSKLGAKYSAEIRKVYQQLYSLNGNIYCVAKSISLSDTLNMKLVVYYVEELSHDKIYSKCVIYDNNGPISKDVFKNVK